MKTENFLINEDEANSRLDVFISKCFEEKSRSYAQKLIEDKNVLVNGSIKKSNYKLKTGDNVEVTIKEDETINIEPEDIKLNILYEDEDVIVIDKPQGMVVHPGNGNYSGTLVNGLLYHCDSLSSINGDVRPGIVHRIDKDTSGVLVVAKNDNAHIILSEQLKEHSMKREYVALVEGIIKDDEGTIDEPLGRNPKDRIKRAVVRNGKNAITHYEVIRRFNKNTLVKCILETGRTHQIRVHMAHINHPLVGDPMYGFKKQRFKLNGQMLHARKLGFIHPSSKKYMEFQSELPNYYKEILFKLSKEE
ncbi:MULTISPECIES: RluA family pseudouridine synthase [Clostridium]|uniref:Pseudouridine synthase n=1 Tax=Clostridium novyi (strain NT) TaxID=386415 RepID=A0Q073_CLONN|nr:MULTISPECIES: RluA family pseudouridine synthase [Clostridium]ABK60619.1 ribosomal large subunit pseudouridine synthase, RluD subfamily [Clostridium novyi NT]KEH85492.1 pseudouridine synthase [Clostridium novyi A str. NCTC 538]KEH86543.1 pseudouridine synthase [Clostridium novyi A str. BKT29909]KEH87900.1 pseudouridine synthase [Clostridium novyi A str. 4540]KEH93429.1 pseudouridine synthase [Clostridium botulinum C/D str. It1]